MGDYYIFDAPKISNFDSSLSDTNFESLLQNCNFGQQSIFDHQVSDFSLIQQQGISFDQNTNSAQQVFPFYEEQFPFDQNFHLEQQQQQFSFDHNNNFCLIKTPILDNNNFLLIKTPILDNNNFLLIKIIILKRTLLIFKKVLFFKNFNPNPICS